MLYPCSDIFTKYITHDYLTASIGLLVDVVSWAVEQENDRFRKLPVNMRQRSRTVLIVIESVFVFPNEQPPYPNRNFSDIAMMDRYRNAFEKSIKDVSVGKYTEETHRPELELWSELLKKDIVMTSASVS